MDDYTERIDKENEFINHRVSWLLTSQSILGTAYVLASRAGAAQPGTVPDFLSWLPKLGLISSCLIYISIFAAIRGITYIRAERPGLGQRSLLFLGLVAPALLPLVCFVSWSLLIKDTAWRVGGWIGLPAILVLSFLWTRQGRK